MSAGGPDTLPLNIMRKRTAEEVNKDVSATADRFRERFEGKTASVSERKAETTTMVNEYYDLVTDFYEYGWGQHFHFAPRYFGESFFESIARHEYFLAYQGQFKPTDTVLDLGCGVGGPARNIVRFTNCNVMGVNNNEYQISRARRHDTKHGMNSKINYTKTDFSEMCFGDNEFDGAYAVEATCHASDKVKCFKEVYRVIKPGSYFVLYEWCVTDKYDPNNEEHRRIIHQIELGDSLPELETAQQVLRALEASGFTVEDSFDVAERFESSPIKNTAWYAPLQGSYTTLTGFKSTPVGRWITNKMCHVLEFVGLAPRGTYKTTEILEEAVKGLVLGGEMGIFTPSFFVKARKPLPGEKQNK
ncbi:sterol 24-c-methyltransferase [Trypanosoma rangeli]|uniref:Methyltransferase n=1 Tax=Trypanosoma rangeli TaxID=5698 RepID=A0A422N3F9_TRYRA|nr:sterol 24-c-methyltransferase [Trypanosoma rangeli]RNE99971.1 sterol 24-c-methyltransferase [Trypanosoma rangeli]|eukprot:RNE99971.1 sterol 24-c-methyltransferase [Trypanosoma rangeli]